MPTASAVAPAANASPKANSSPSKTSKAPGAAQKQSESLIKYDNPINVTDSPQHALQRQASSVGATLKTSNGPLPLDGKNLAAFNNMHQKDADAVLRAILPAKYLRLVLLPQSHS